MTDPDLLATIVAAAILMYSVKATGMLRVAAAGEIEGLDLHEHGMLAYPEYVIHGYDPVPHAVGGASQGMGMMVAQSEPAGS